MPLTYKTIASVTVASGGAANITFASIPQTFTDLVVKFSGRSNGTSFSSAPWQNLSLTLNSNNTPSGRQVYATGGGIGTDTNNAGVWATSNNATANTFSNVEIYIPNYTNSAAKSVGVDNVTENNGSDFAIVLWGANYSSVTAAVTSLTLTTTSGSILQYSTATLYGIKNS